MLTLHTANYAWPLVSTKFPDGTSQVWKLPEGILQAKDVTIDWRFEHEREIMDLLSLRKLLVLQDLHLYMPFLPYGRQDKEVSNTSTFNLEVLGDLLNSMEFVEVSTFDAHNPAKTQKLINKFSNINPSAFHYEVVTACKPDFVVFPDSGAAGRYAINFKNSGIPIVICDKARDQLTGVITGHTIVDMDTLANPNPNNYLIVDDLCDGGATFISVAKLLRDSTHCGNVDLCVSHGVFSRGKEHLLSNGINNIYTTNSLAKNKDGYSV